MDKKTYLPVICFLALSVVLGGTCVQQYFRIKTLDSKVEQQSKSLAQQSQEMNTIRKNSENLALQKTWLTQESTTLREKVKTLKAEIAESEAAEAQPEATPSPKKGASGFKGMVAEMMKDPDLKEMVNKQNKLHIEGQMGELTKALGLTPDQGRKLVDLLIQQQNNEMDNLSGDLNPSDASKSANRYKENQAALKSLLGDDKYAQYEDYQKAAPSRFAAEQLKQQLSSTQTPLQDAQAQSVAQMIQEEQSRKTPGSVSQADLKPEDYSNPDKLDAVFATMEETNKRILDRARSFLSGPQLEAFTLSQTRALETQKMGLKWAGKMLQSK